MVKKLIEPLLTEGLERSVNHFSTQARFRLKPGLRSITFAIELHEFNFLRDKGVVLYQQQRLSQNSFEIKSSLSTSVFSVSRESLEVRQELRLARGW